MAAKRAVPRKVGKMRLTDGDKPGKGDSGSPYALMPLSFREALNAGSLVAGNFCSKVISSTETP
jgi:hypothetical protein